MLAVAYCSPDADGVSPDGSRSVRKIRPISTSVGTPAIRSLFGKSVVCQEHYLYLCSDQYLLIMKTKLLLLVFAFLVVGNVYADDCCRAITDESAGMSDMKTPYVKIAEWRGGTSLYSLLKYALGSTRYKNHEIDLLTGRNFPAFCDYVKAAFGDLCEVSDDNHVSVGSEEDKPAVLKYGENAMNSAAVHFERDNIYQVYTFVKKDEESINDLYNRIEEDLKKLGYEAFNDPKYRVGPAKRWQFYKDGRHLCYQWYTWIDEAQCWFLTLWIDYPS